jgi:hypothetical protein
VGGIVVGSVLGSVLESVVMKRSNKRYTVRVRTRDGFGPQRRRYAFQAHDSTRAIQTKQPLNRAMCAGAPCSMNICVRARFSAVFQNNSKSQHGRIATTCSISNCGRFAI